MSEELLSCPFCGGGARTGAWSTWYVKCIDCGVEVIGLTEAEAIAAWNRRSPPTHDEARSGSGRWRQLLTGRKANLPHRDPGKRIVGFVVDEEVAGLSDGLFMLEELVAALDGGWRPDRVAIAEIVHPRAFRTVAEWQQETWCRDAEDAQAEVDYYAPERATALAKADAILALTNSDDGWRPIETAPRDTDVLLYCPRLALSNPERIELGQAVMTHGQERGWSYHSWATHWMPLPSLPNPTTQAEGGAA